MCKGSRVDADEERRICDLLVEGQTTRQVGEAVGRPSSTVSNVAKRNGLNLVELAHDHLKRGQLVGLYRRTETRASVAAKILERGEQFLDTCETARDFRDASVAAAIGLDKLRQELPPIVEEQGGEIRLLFEKMRADEKIEIQQIQ